MWALELDQPDCGLQNKTKFESQFIHLDNRIEEEASTSQFSSCKPYPFIATLEMLHGGTNEMTSVKGLAEGSTHSGAV